PTHSPRGGCGTGPSLPRRSLPATRRNLVAACRGSVYRARTLHHRQPECRTSEESRGTSLLPPADLVPSPGSMQSRSASWAYTNERVTSVERESACVSQPGGTVLDHARDRMQGLIPARDPPPGCLARR